MAIMVFILTVLLIQIRILKQIEGTITAMIITIGSNEGTELFIES